MSSVLRPAGPLPPRIYWVRRLLVVVALVLVLSALWWVIRAFTGSSTDAEANPAQTVAVDVAWPPPGAMPNRGTLLADLGRATTPAERNQPSLRGSDGPGSGEGQPGRAPLAEPTGDCDPRDVGMEVNVDDTTMGEPAKVTLSLTSTTTPACTLGITSKTLALRVISGSDVVWSSDDCPNLLPARQVVVRTPPATDYVFEWDGRRSVTGCAAGGAVAEPGGYWVQAALVRARVHQGYFEITK